MPSGYGFRSSILRYLRYSTISLPHKSLGFKWSIEFFCFTLFNIGLLQNCVLQKCNVFSSAFVGQSQNLNFWCCFYAWQNKWSNVLKHSALEVPLPNLGRLVPLPNFSCLIMICKTFFLRACICMIRQLMSTSGNRFPNIRLGMFFSKCQSASVRKMFYYK